MSWSNGADAKRLLQHAAARTATRTPKSFSRVHRLVWISSVPEDVMKLPLISQPTTQYTGMPRSTLKSSRASVGVSLMTS